jgi:hypothetical protein
LHHYAGKSMSHTGYRIFTQMLANIWMPIYPCPKIGFR